MFTDSVIAQMPVSDLALDDEPATQPFAAPEPERPREVIAGQWREPGAEPSRTRGPTSLRARSSPISASVLDVAARAASRPIEISNADAPKAPAPAAAFATPSEPFGTRPAAVAPSRDLPSGALTAPKPAGSRATSGPIEPRVSARARAVSADVAPLAEAQGTRTLEFEPSPAGSGLELDTPAAPRANSIRPKLTLQGTGPAPRELSAPPRDPKPVPAADPSLRPAASAAANSLAPAAAAAQVAKSPRPPAGAEDVERSPSGRPIARQKRAEARRAARRAAAKHLPPPPTPLIRGWDPARMTLAAFAGIVALSALVIGAATAGLITLPPAAAAMLGLDSAHASLSQTRPRGKPPNLVMPSAPAKPQASPPAPVVRVPAAQPPAAAAPAPQPAAAAPAVPAPSAAPAEPQAPPPVAAPVPVAANAVEVAPTPEVVPPEREAPPPPSAAAAAPPAAASAGPGDSSAEPAASPDDARLVRMARGLLARDPPGAAEMMMKLIARSPDDHHAMEVLVRAWIAMGRGKDAVGYAERIVKKRPKRAIYRLLEGDAKQLAGDRAGAEAAWRAVLALEPNDRDAKRRLGL